MMLFMLYSTEKVNFIQTENKSLPDHIHVFSSPAGPQHPGILVPLKARQGPQSGPWAPWHEKDLQS